MPSLILLSHRSDCAFILCLCRLGDSWSYRLSQKVRFNELRAVPVTSDFCFQPSILSSSICWELTMHLIFFLCKVSVGTRSKGFPKFFEKSDSFQRRCCHLSTKVLTVLIRLPAILCSFSNNNVLAHISVEVNSNFNLATSCLCGVFKSVENESYILCGHCGTLCVTKS